ncbi:MAG: glutamine synthetase beta-grasp domain-containing protein, partial [Phycisphaerales bacterium]
MPDIRASVSPNRVAQHLGIDPHALTKAALVKFIEDNNIRMVNFRYLGGDGRLKTLNFVITSKAHLDRLLSAGERVDGSSLFSFIDAASSDLYVVPRYKTAFVNPYAPAPTVDILATYYT